MATNLTARVSSLWSAVRARVRAERAAVSTEYALLLSLIALAIVAGATAFGVALADRLQSGADCVATLPSC